MICRFNFFMTEVTVIKESVQSSCRTKCSCRTKWFTILESQFTGNPELFWIKKILISTLNIVRGILCHDIISKRSKIRKSPAI